MTDFEIGDVVQLRSGGPKMTVHGVISDGDLVCEWFETDVVHHEENFPNEALKKVEQVAVGGSRRDDGEYVMY